MIPDYQTLMLPVLKASAQGEVSNAEVVDRLADEFALSEDEREQLLPSGKQTTFRNRVSWAKGYLKQAGLVRYTKYGHFVITPAGLEVLSSNPNGIDIEFLSQFESFQKFRNRKGTNAENPEDAAGSTIVTQSGKTPDEVLRAAHKQINQSLAAYSGMIRPPIPKTCGQ